MKMRSKNLVLALAVLVFYGLQGVQAMANAPDLIKLHTAVAIGAVCLDGSPPAYQLDWGKEDGAKNWLLHLQGGYWCTTTQECQTRMNDSSGLGSSTKMKRSYFSGILTNNETLNPYFYNWNRVFVRYCDGSCFTGDKQEFSADGPYYRGSRVFSAIIDELMKLGMKNAQNVLLSGSSAGGLGTMVHCDRFRNRFPTSTKFKCLSDASYFITLNNPSGFVELHGSSKNLPETCTSKMDAALIAATVRLPVNTSRSCLYNLTGCPDTVRKQWKNLRLKILQEVTMGDLSKRGLFINSCHTHSQSEFQSKWLGDPKSMLDNMTISEAVGKWFNDEKLVQLIDRKHSSTKQCVLDASEPNACNNYTWGASYLCNT
ncbi:pectin acetylesterase 8 isoform X4 [Daucus carota subsp. sativus]|uniref:pectin acetylesterase 8 isoform X4 n=1 Tax=Daucus carota subsp. sativus TaxID=79200 RepID=UPI00308324EC